jgi:dTDP-4-dehydrorhamnose 3,5-epimerase
VEFLPTTLDGAFVVRSRRLSDERGYFERAFCSSEFEGANVRFDVSQVNLSYNRQRGTVRGMHWQAAPSGEQKLVRCVAGAVFDVVVDLREGSSTRYRWFGVELSAEASTALFIPTGFAHGFQTLSDDAELLYLMDGRYVPEAARGLRWDDPSIAIAWPLPATVISDRDAAWPRLPS